MQILVGYSSRHIHIFISPQSCQSHFVAVSAAAIIPFLDTLTFIVLNLEPPPSGVELLP